MRSLNWASVLYVDIGTGHEGLLWEVVSLLHQPRPSVCASCQGHHYSRHHTSVCPVSPSQPSEIKLMLDTSGLCQLVHMFLLCLDRIILGHDNIGPIYRPLVPRPLDLYLDPSNYMRGPDQLFHVAGPLFHVVSAPDHDPDQNSSLGLLAIG